jgi:hypothetical protein
MAKAQATESWRHSRSTELVGAHPWQMFIVAAMRRQIMKNLAVLVIFNSPSHNLSFLQALLKLLHFVRNKQIFCEDLLLFL